MGKFLQSRRHALRLNHELRVLLVDPIGVGINDVTDFIDTRVEEDWHMSKRHAQDFVMPVDFVINLSIMEEPEGWSLES